MKFADLRRRLIVLRRRLVIGIISVNVACAIFLLLMWWFDGDAVALWLLGAVLTIGVISVYRTVEEIQPYSNLRRTVRIFNDRKRQKKRLSLLRVASRMRPAVHKKND